MKPVELTEADTEILNNFYLDLQRYFEQAVLKYKPHPDCVSLILLKIAAYELFHQRPDHHGQLLVAGLSKITEEFNKLAEQAGINFRAERIDV